DFEVSEAIQELFGFVFQFVAVGAVAFRAFVLRRSREPEIFDRASRRAATLGLIGAIGSMFMFMFARMGTAARQHKTLSQVMTANSVSIVQTICAFLLVL